MSGGEEKTTKQETAMTTAETQEYGGCPVCGAFKFSFEELCKGCKEHKEFAIARKRAAARRRAFGDIWCD